MTAAMWAFVRRDHLIMTSYRFSFLLQALVVIGIVIGLNFAGRVLFADAQHIVNGISKDYFDYMLTGLAFADVLTVGLSAFPRAVQSGYSSGTLEAMLLAHFRLSAIVLFSSIHGFLVSLLRFSIYAVTAVFVFGLWHETNFLSAFCIFSLSVVTFGALGVLSTAFVLVLKQGDPVISVYGASSLLFGGVLFPVSVLPDWIQPFSALVPLTHSLTGMRLALQGVTVTDLMPQIMSLIVMNLVFVPSSIFMFNWALNRAKREGSLVQY